MITKAIVLAAGRGTRMGVLTEDLPKPMLTIEGRPILEHIVRRLQKAGLQQILIITGYRRELIENHFQSGFPGVSFGFQSVVEGTASAVKLGRVFAGNDPFLLTFGDIITRAANYKGICDDLTNHNAAAVVGVKHVADPWQGAAVYADDKFNVTRIIEKPPQGTSSTNWNSAGLYAFSRRIFEEIETQPKSARGEYEITTAIEQLIDHQHRVRMFDMQGAWRDVGRPEDLILATEDLLASGE